MRKIILYIAQSLDGYIAESDGGLDWLNIVTKKGEDYGFAAFAQNIDTAFVGRKTYEETLEFAGLSAMGSNCYVFTSKPEEKEGKVQFVNPPDLVEFVNQIKSKEGKNIWLIGGGELIKHFIENNLIDEYIISILPIILGNGLPLFVKSNGKTQIKLHETKTFDTGLVQMVYTK